MLPPAYVPILVGGMLLTGCSNSLLTKWQDMLCVEGCAPNDDRPRVLFEQPVWQTLQMFVGEMLCFLPVLFAYVRARRYSRVRLTDAPEQDLSEDDAREEEVEGDAVVEKASPMGGWQMLLLFFPAFFDLTGTTLMNVGLIYTPVSIYQMTRGALVLWVGLFSVMFLRRKLWLYQWLALVTVVIGVSIVGLSGSLAKEAVSVPDALRLALRVRDENGEAPPTAVFVGVLFVLFAQVFAASQFVVEEKIMERYSISPLMAVGLEGVFGFVSVLVAMPFLSFLAPQSPFFDFPRGWAQITSSQPVMFGTIAVALSIAFFNFFGLSVTRHVSATARATTDTCRTLGIWLVSLGLGWERLVWPFSFLQVVGFGLLVYGTFLFNNLVSPPSLIRPSTSPLEDEGLVAGRTHEDREEERALLSERVLDETAALPVDLGRSGYDVVPPPSSSGPALEVGNGHARG